MPSATGRDLYIDKALSNVALGFRPEGFIADMLAPIVPVPQQTGKYYIFSRADRLRVDDTTRAPGTAARIVTESVNTGTYVCDNYALKRRVPIEDMANADPVLQAGIINGRVELVTGKLLTDWERRVTLAVTSTSNVGSSSAVTSAWNGAGHPITDINAAIDNVHYAQGVMPNRIAMGVEAWKAFRRDSNVRNLIFGANNGGGYPSREQVANLFDIPANGFLIGGSFFNSGEEGLAEALSTIWADNVLVYFTPMSPNVEQPSFMYSFRWQQPNVPNMQVERHPYDRKIKAEEVEVGYYQDEAITASGYGFLVQAVNSST